MIFWLLLILLLIPNPIFGSTYQPRQTARVDNQSLLPRGTKAIKNQKSAQIKSKRRIVPVKYRKLDTNPVLIKAWMCAYGLKYKVKPSAVAAVGHVESRIGKLEFREGQMGSFNGPMGLKNIRTTTERNIEIGAKSLAYFGPVNTLEQLKHVLKKRYNATFDKSYWNEIVKAEAKYAKEYGIKPMKYNN